jgi:hypothetical protein
VACGEGQRMTFTRDGGWPPLLPTFDDTRAILEEIAWC